MVGRWMFIVKLGGMVMDVAMKLDVATMGVAMGLGGVAMGIAMGLDLGMAIGLAIVWGQTRGITMVLAN